MQLIGIRQTPDVKAPADRLVLFVGDGLRADKAFQSFPDPYPKTDDDLFWGFAYPGTYRVPTRPCCSHRRAIRGCVGRRDWLEIEPRQL
ncbi:GPI ethanolamine phosphate transferase 1 like protein [Verticillium longisporum]|nr:GPI ethanolamine phosphate transferase 1 like protein [Verticillium longisporum]